MKCRTVIATAISLPIEIKEKLDFDRGDVSLSRFILRIIEKHYNYKFSDSNTLRGITQRHTTKVNADMLNISYQQAILRNHIANDNIIFGNNIVPENHFYKSGAAVAYPNGAINESQYANKEEKKEISEKSRYSPNLLISQRTRVVVHCLHEPYDVYIGRQNNRYNKTESIYHNPYIEGKDGTRQEVIEKFRVYFYSNPELQAVALNELPGKVLGCWCHPGPCHGDGLAEWVNNNLNVFSCYYCDSFATDNKSEYERHVCKDHSLECLPYPCKDDIERLNLTPQGKSWEI